MDLVVGNNTYITIEECSDLISNYFGENSKEAVSFGRLENSDKQSAIYRSFMDMQRLLYQGRKLNKDQYPAFPRINKLGYESIEEDVKLAQALNTTFFIPSSDSDSSSTLKDVANLSRNGITKYKLGSFEVSLNGNLSTSSVKKSSSGYVETVLKSWLQGGFRTI